MSLAVLFFRRGFRGTWTWSTCDTLFCDFPEGRADRRDTGDMSALLDRLSLKFFDTKTTGRQKMFKFDEERKDMRGAALGHKLYTFFLHFWKLDIH